MPHLTQENYRQESQSDQCCPGLGCCVEGDGGREFTFEEIVHSCASEVSCDSTLTAWGISWSQGFSCGNTDSSQFALVDSSGVVATGCGSSDCVDNLVINLDRHAVARFDSLNLVPANSDFTQHIGDRDTFIKEDNLWSKEENIGSQSNCCTNCCNFDEAFTISDNEIIGENSQAQENAQSKKYIVTSRAVRNDVTHSRIITHISNRGSKEALA